MTAPKIGDMVWHIHHEGLLEPLSEPFATRVAYIKADKPKSEVLTRLRLMKPVRGNLSFLNKACAEWVKAYVEWREANDEWSAAMHGRTSFSKAYNKLNKTRAKWRKIRRVLTKANADPRVLALHEKECPNCPWNGRTIFP